jgi:hypothetical protein
MIIGEDREEILFGIQALENLDANYIVYREDITVQEPHLGIIWFAHLDYEFVNCLLRLSQLGSTWKIHPKHSVLQLYQQNIYDTTLDVLILF